MKKTLLNKFKLMWIALILILLSCNNTKQKTIALKKNSLNDSLVKELNTVRLYDQEHRSDTTAVGMQSQAQNDAFNLSKIERILNNYGWPHPDTIGEYGSETILLVLQHSHISIQRKYLPMVRKAVIDGKLSGKSWVFLEDRVSLSNTGKQLYGTQVETNQNTGEYFISPIIDERNVNIRRKKIGLESIETYASSWGINYKISY
jgi:hypothetical protein